MCSKKHCRKPIASSGLCWSCLQQRKKDQDPIKYAYWTLRNNARRRNKEFTITLEYFRQFAYEVDLLQRRGRESLAYHIDRIDDDLGYTPGNLQLLTCEDNLKKEHTRRKRVSYDYQTKRGYIIDERDLKTTPQEEEVPF